MTKQYYSTGYVSQKAAEELGPEIERIAERNVGRRLTAWDLREEAVTNPDSPIRRHITWDTERAAEQWQLQECRTIMDSVKVRIVSAGGEVVRDSAVVICIQSEPKVKVDDGAMPHNLRPYVLADAVTIQPELQDAAIQEAARLVAAFRRRLEGLKDLFAGRCPSFDRLQATLDDVAREIEQDEVGRELVTA